MQRPTDVRSIREHLDDLVETGAITREEADLMIDRLDEHDRAARRLRPRPRPSPDPPAAA